MNRKRSQLQAYFAGILDGEGSIGLYVNNYNVHSLRVKIQMTEPLPLGLLWREYPEAVFTADSMPLKGLSRPFSVVFNGNKAYAFLQDTIPFLFVKWEQAKVALSYLVHKRRVDIKHTLPCVECNRYAMLLRTLKQPEINGVKTVEPLLRHEMREYRANQEDVEDDVRIIRDKLTSLLAGVETRDRNANSVEPISSPEQDIVQRAA